MKAKWLYWKAEGFTKTSRHKSLVTAIFKKETSYEIYISNNCLKYKIRYSYTDLDQVLYFFNRGEILHESL